ncbi:hypothetical protein MRX96_042938 [Rhipicephalus microplus]
MRERTRYHNEKQRGSAPGGAQLKTVVTGCDAASRRQHRDGWARPLAVFRPSRMRGRSSQGRMHLTRRRSAAPVRLGTMARASGPTSVRSVRVTKRTRNVTRRRIHGAACVPRNRDGRLRAHTRQPWYTYREEKNE